MAHVQPPTADLNTVTIPISGMTCAGCASRVQRALASKAGVIDAQVNFAGELASVTFSPGAVSAADVADVVEDVGYHVPSESIALEISGMICASCAGRVEKALLSVPAVQAAQVNAATEVAHVAGTAGFISVTDLIAAVDAAGYSASRATSSVEQQAETEVRDARSARNELYRLMAAAGLTTPLVAPMLLAPFGVHLMLPGWVQLALAAPVQLIFGARFYRGAWKTSAKSFSEYGHARRDRHNCCVSAFRLASWH